MDVSKTAFMLYEFLARMLAVGSGGSRGAPRIVDARSQRQMNATSNDGGRNAWRALRTMRPFRSRSMQKNWV